MCPEALSLQRGARADQGRGFTLIEMMIVVAVIALLGMVAIPGYQSSIAKSRRADARSALTTAAQMMERYSTENARAGYSTATLGTSGGANVVYGTQSENKFYTLSLANLAAATFTLRAVPGGAQATDPCGTFTLNERGERGVSGGTKTVAECW